MAKKNQPWNESSIASNKYYTIAAGIFFLICLMALLSEVAKGAEPPHIEQEQSKKLWIAGALAFFSTQHGAVLNPDVNIAFSGLGPVKDVWYINLTVGRSRHKQGGDFKPAYTGMSTDVLMGILRKSESFFGLKLPLHWSAFAGAGGTRFLGKTIPTLGYELGVEYVVFKHLDLALNLKGTVLVSSRSTTSTSSKFVNIQVGYTFPFH